jgi:NAD dependent epimerase/dehydratase family enzyme
MRLGITGATGFIGRRAAQLAAARGWEVVPFSRHPRDAGTRLFTPGEPADVDGLDAVLNLAGEPVLGWWTKDKRRRIMDSRVRGTRSVVEGFARAARPPRVLVSGSAVGFYGDTGDTRVSCRGLPGVGSRSGASAVLGACDPSPHGFRPRTRRRRHEDDPAGFPFWPRR